MNVARVLIADGDAQSRARLEATIQTAKMAPLTAENGAQALDIWRAGLIAMVIIDAGLAEPDGLAVCRYIRRVSDVPIILLLTKANETEIARGLEHGADYCVAKPFEPKALIMRMNTLLGGIPVPRAGRGNRLMFGNLTLDLDARRVVRAGKIISMTALEFKLLRYLMLRFGTIVSKAELYENVWGYVAPEGTLNLIAVAVCRLRAKIEPDSSRPNFIHSVPGGGYWFGDLGSINAALDSKQYDRPARAYPRIHANPGEFNPSY